jgi:putative nucleotidyltransferase with HDIG domain
LATLVGAAFFNGLASASIAILLQFLLALFLGLTTPMQLSDLTRPDHPLLQGLLHDAPGTYQHSLQVANLAEQAAEQIGADPLLTRVGALYHDIGKTLNPFFFIENQPTGFLNPHDSLNSVDSASIIIRHVEDGLEMGRKYRLPRRILDFIAEHHGNMLTRYQYVQAVKAAGGDESQVDIELYRYPGPRPQSRETGILMLADSSEARVRAEHPTDVETLNTMIKEVIDDRVSKGQLDDTGLSLRDLSKIRRTFTTTLRGIYHPRIVYPQLESTSSHEVPTTPVSETASASADVPVDLSVDVS